jgi:hypothetical protein
MRKTISPLEKFLKNVNVGNEGECWLWKGRLTKYGVGLFTIEHTVDGKRTVETYFANRFSYEHFTGNKIATRYLDNICLNRNCCNPEHMRPRDFDARFWENTDRTSGCWIWQGAFCASTGYGDITIDHKSCPVHRIAYEIYYNAEIPKGKMVLHSCDHKTCINPEHLHIGTHLDNMQEAIDRGRTCKGEKNGNSIYTEKQIREIKTYMKGHPRSLRWMSRTLAIPRSTLRDIQSGRCWGWVKIEELL